MEVHLIRHASAGRRDNSDPSDVARCLDALGSEQAHGLARAFAPAPITLVLSSPARRCMETVGPLAAHHGLTVIDTVALLEHRPPTEALHLIETLASDDHAGDVVMCSHGDIIPDLVRALQARGTRLGPRTGWEKASTWSMRLWNGHTFEVGDYTPAPTLPVPSS